MSAEIVSLTSLAFVVHQVVQHQWNDKQLNQHIYTSLGTLVTWQS